MNFRYNIKFYYFSELFLIILLFECHLINVVTPFTSITREQFNSINNDNNNYLNNNKNNNNNLSSYQKIYKESKNINSNNNNNNGCMSNRLAFYKVILHTYWSRDLFPKHYPDWRPSAQWTKTLGKSHNSNFSLFHIGQQASDGVKEFVETGQTNILENTQPYYTIPSSSDIPSSSSSNSHSSSSLSSSSTSLSHSSSGTSSSSTSTSSSLASIKQLQNEGGILDEFSISPILTGEGQREAKFFADDNHSLVSLMTRIVPSPDWFIGVDSFQLCIGGTWIDTVTLEMDPLDAGTDNGFTFTAPNWPTNPQGVIYRITSKYPSHPAGSFFYPKNKRLPPIATFQFIKVKEYELSEEFKFKTDEHNYETIRTQTHLESEHNHVEINNELSANIENERQNEIITDHPISYTKKDRIRARMLAKINPLKNSTSAATSTLTTTTTTINDNKIYVLKNDKNAILNSIAMNYNNKNNNNNNEKIIYKIHKNNKKKRVKHKSKVDDCRVGHWSNWGPCSKTCGIGEMRRYRKIIKYSKRGGRPCPPLQESKWCGNEKYCNTVVEWNSNTEQYTFVDDDNRPKKITSFNWSYT